VLSRYALSSLSLLQFITSLVAFGFAKQPIQGVSEQVPMAHTLNIQAPLKDSVKTTNQPSGEKQ
jgi:hypothetical protein